MIDGINIIDADTGEEFNNIIPPRECVIPHAGETIHYWVDAGYGAGHSLRDFKVVRVVHDWRHMPQYDAKTRVVIVIYVKCIGGEDGNHG